MITKRVILSAGHGKGSPGSYGQGKTEYSQTVDIVNRTAWYLKRDGQLPYVVVPPELDVAHAIAWVNARYKRINDGIAVEVHKNDFSNSSANGLETWYGDPGTTSQVIATKLHKKLIEITKLRDRGIKTYKNAPQGGLVWISQTNTWALLPEMGFMDSDTMNNDLYAKALFEGILNMWGLKPRVVKPPVPLKPLKPPVDPCIKTTKELAKVTGLLYDANSNIMKLNAVILKKDLEIERMVLAMGDLQGDLRVCRNKKDVFAESLEKYRGEVVLEPPTGFWAKLRWLLGKGG